MEDDTRANILCTRLSTDRSDSFTRSTCSNHRFRHPRSSSLHLHPYVCTAQPSPLRSVSALASSAAPCDRTCFLRQGKICARIRRVCSGTRVWYDGELRPIAQKFKTACLLRLGGLTNWWMGVRSSAANCGFVSAGRSDADPRWTECAKLCGKGC
jgi:hypothetical protein